MAEVMHDNQIEELISKWKLGAKFDQEGYEDLGFSIQLNALEEIVKLSQDDRQKIADRLFPKQ